MKYNEKLIKKLQKGELALYNDGNIDDLISLLKYAFPKDNYYEGTFLNKKFFYQDWWDNNTWHSGDTTDLPHKSINEFIIKQEKNKLPERWCISRGLSILENKIVTDWFNQKFSGHYLDKIFTYDYYFYNGGHGSKEDITNQNLTEITFEQFNEHILMKENFPKDDFGVIIQDDNGIEVIEFLAGKGFNNSEHFIGSAANETFYYINKNQNFIKSSNKEEKEECRTKNPTSRTYTLKQLQDLYNMTNNKIIGYQLIKEYPGSKNLGFIEKYTTGEFSKYPEFWKPLHAPTQKIINMGKFNLTINSDGIFHKQQNIVNYVKEVNDWWENTMKNGHLRFVNFDFHFNDIVLTKTGCEYADTKLSQWLEVWKEYKAIKC